MGVWHVELAHATAVVGGESQYRHSKLAPHELLEAQPVLSESPVKFKAVAKVHALRGIDLDLLRGTFTAIMGPGGWGKSASHHPYTHAPFMSDAPPVIFLSLQLPWPD